MAGAFDDVRLSPPVAWIFFHQLFFDTALQKLGKYAE